MANLSTLPINGAFAPGDIIIDLIEIQFHDKTAIGLKSALIDMVIYEDIFSNFISGQITISDGFDLLGNNSIIGGEQLRFKFSTPGMHDDKGTIVDYTAIIHKVSDRVQVNQYNQVLVLHFMAPEAFVNEMKKVSKYFEGSIGDTIKEIFTKSMYLGSDRPIRIERPSNDLKFVSPFWTPAKIINWFATRSLRVGTKSPDFLFFETLTRGFQYTSLSSLYQSSVITFYTNASGLQSGYEDYRDLNAKYAKILDIHFDEIFDIIKRAKTGFYNSKAMIANTLTKNLIVQTYDARDMFSLYSHTNGSTDNPAINPVPQNHVVSSNAHLSSFINQQFIFNGQRDFAVKDWYIQRNYVLSLLNSTKTFEIEVNGRFDIGAGRKVYVQIEKIQILNESDEGKEINAVNRALSGNYLITACAHNISVVKGRARHTMTLQCCTDSLATEFPKVLLNPNDTTSNYDTIMQNSNA